MRRIIYLVLFVTTISCSTQTSSTGQEKSEAATIKKEYVWTKVLDSADWRKNYNFQMFSVRDTLWTFHPDGNWYSIDGQTCTKSKLPNSIFNLAFLDYVYFNNAIYGLGHFVGNIEVSRPEIGLHELTCKQDEKIR